MEAVETAQSKRMRSNPFIVCMESDLHKDFGKQATDYCERACVLQKEYL